MDQANDLVVSKFLAQFLENLWSKRRLEVEEMLEVLERRREETTAAELKSAIGDWMSFLEFLRAECSGANFDNDKQWGELLNLMEISRKLNHRSIKLKDILKNKLIIEANAANIRRLNRSAKLLKTIEWSLDELDRLVQGCKLELPGAESREEKQSLLSKRLAASSSYLKNRCLALMYTLKLELADESIKADPRLPAWQERLKKQEGMITKLASAVDSLASLGFRIRQVAPLVALEASGERATGSKDENQINSSIASCKRKFAGINQFNEKLLASIERLADKKRVLQLSKLYDSRKQEMVDEMYSDGLKKALKELESCQESLDKIMQTLRLEFGRFYFVNDLELLTIISLDLKLVLMDKDDSSVRMEKERLVGKLFNNSINSFVLDKERKLILGVQSPVGEIVYFSQEDSVILRKKINVYSVEIVRVLNEILRKLSKTLKRLSLESLASNKKQDEPDWSLPIQLIQLTEFIKFVSKVEDSFVSREANRDKLIQFYEVRAKSFAQVQPEVASNLKKSAITSLTMHFISSLMRLEEAKADEVGSWHWQKQVRYYLSGEEIQVRIADSKFAYRFDFLPIEVNELASGTEKSQATFKRLVNTEITERCFLACSHSNYSLKLGANPYGPAGSGKTETVKALGHLLGCQVIVHNCDESNDSASLEKLIWGLAHTGLWGCFDEFNRLKVSVLSSVSATLELVQSSLREGRSTVESAAREGQLMRIDPSSAFFVTLNPAGNERAPAKNYGGRQRLPANIRSLFVPISMARVEVGTIVSDYLMSFASELKLDLNSAGALQLAKKLESYLDRMRLELSDCGNRCEWDLRLVMAILRRFKCSLVRSQAGGSLEEQFVSSIRGEVSPRLASQDELIAFELELEEIFQVSRVRQLVSANELPLDKLDFVGPEVKEHLLELSEQLKVRSGVILLGAPKSGKSQTWRLLAESLKETVRWFPVNPKAFEKDKLFGHVEEATQKWIDGVFTRLVRDALEMLQKSDKLQQVWLVLDGPIDPNWIESLNSVLDDNQVLTLSSGERITFVQASGKSIKLILETDSIQFASPATISRMGLINFAAPTTQSTQRDTNEEQVLRKFIEGDNRLLVVETEKGPNLYARLANRRSSCVYYSCSRLADCNNLLDLLTRLKEDSCVILDNVHLMEADGWATRSLVELLRFVVTYGAYYDGSNSPIAVPNMKFLVLVPSIQFMEEERRLMAQTQVFLADLTGRDKRAVIRGKNMIEVISNSNDDQIVSWISKLRGTKRAQRVRKALEGSRQLFEFRNLNMAKQSIESLETTLLKPTNSAKLKPKLFLLNQIELDSFDASSKRKLFHLLNLLKLSGNRFIKIIYLTHKLPEVDSEFWFTMGSIHDDGVEVGSKFLLEECPLAKILPSSQIEWLNEKLNKLAALEKWDRNDVRRFEALGETFWSFLSASQESLTRRERTIKSGLEQLDNFERSVQRIKSKCDEEDRSLDLQKRQIEELIGQIDSNLVSSKKQQGEIEKLKGKQSIKSQELNRKNKQIQSELSQVKPLVEQSKAQIKLHLKPEALNEIKALRSPPKTIKEILEVLFVLLEVEDSSWTSTKAYLTKRSLKEELVGYDIEKRLVNGSDILRRVEEEIANKRESFNKQQAARASKAVLPIVEWIEATLSYGKVFVKLAPLSKELEALKVEEADLKRQARGLELASSEVSRKIESLGENLKQLELDYESSKQKGSKVKAQLAKAQKVRLELNDQTDRWRATLASLGRLSEATEKRLVATCFLGSLQSVLNDQDDPYESLKKRLEVCELDGKEFLGDLLVLIKSVAKDEDASGDLGELIYGSDEVNRILQLACIEIFHNFCSTELTIWLDTGNNRVSRDELANYLGFKRLAFASQEVSVMRSPRDLNDAQWQQSLEIAIKLNKLILLEVSASGLDLLELIHRRGYRKVIMVGDSRKQATLNDHLKRLSYLVSYETMPIESLQRLLVSHWIKLKNPELGLELERLEKEFSSKQLEIRALEANLLRKLAKSKQEEEQRNGDSFNEDLVVILSDLHSSAKRLKGDLKLVTQRMSELEERRSAMAAFGLEAANFYKWNLADLNKSDEFYHVPLEDYIRLLSAAQQESSPSSGLPVDFTLISEQVQLSMRPKDKRLFRERLRTASSGKWQPGTIINREEQLRDVTLKVLREEGLSVMIVLHDAASSSPQLELDELLRAQPKSELEFYRKVYAASQSDGRLEEAIAKFLSASSQSVTSKASRCLCIANAHLATQWINERLLSSLISSLATSGRFLLVLVGESCSPAKVVSGNPAGESCQFSPEVLDFARLRFWHDELSLSAIERFELMRKRSSNLSGSYGSEWEELWKELILLHVVCQEKTKFVGEVQGGASSEKAWSFSGYNFDYDLFSIALKMLGQILSDGQRREASSVRQTFGHYLDSVVYGSRMETAEDERSLRELVNKFIRSPEKAKGELGRFLSNGGRV